MCWRRLSQRRFFYLELLPLTAPSLFLWLFLSNTKEHPHTHTHQGAQSFAHGLFTLVNVFATFCSQPSLPTFHYSTATHIYTQGAGTQPLGHYHIVALSSKHPAITKPTHTTNTCTCMHYLLSNPRITPRYTQDQATMQTDVGSAC